MSNYLIVNADDFGLTESTNNAIIDAHHQGIVTSASLLANGQAFDHAVWLARENPTLGVGVHLTLTEGRPVDDIGRLAVFVPGMDEPGRFPLSNAPYVRALLTGKFPRKNIMREFKAQTSKIIQAGIKPTHIDGHKYIHLLPPLPQIAADIADLYGIRYMRLPRPADSWLTAHPRRLPGMLALGLLSLLALPAARTAHLRTAGRFLGFTDTGHLTLARLRAILRKPRRGVTEVVCHPAYRSAALSGLQQQGYEWIAGYNFEEETAAVSSPELRRELQAAGWTLAHFGQMAG
ncbi:MAG: ChbG/HpnK family deacetylase [Chloroflexi bacterium]|nr:ChbG/HpnK family deacetylase [Chloroflexota bacterium]